MGTKAKIMGQAKPAAITNTTLYTVPALTEAQGTLTCCNQTTGDDKIRIALVRSGEVLSAKHYVAYDAVIPANGILDKSFDLGAGDVLQVYSTNGNVSFTAAGLEVS